MDKYISNKLKTLSFLLIIFVVFLHSYNLSMRLADDIKILPGLNSFVQEFISFGVTRVAVPLFFLISGYLFFQNFSLKRKLIISKLKKRTVSLLIPYLLWSAIVFLFYYILQSIPFLQTYFNNELIINIPVNQVLNRLLLNPLPYQLWFLRDLMTLVVASPIIFICVKYGKQLFIFALLFLWFNRLDLIIIQNEALLFYSLGGYLQIHSTNINFPKLRKYTTVFFALWLSLLILRIILVKQNILNYHQNIYIYKTTITIGVITVWLLYDKVVNNERFKNLTDFKIYNLTFFLYLTHEPVLTILKKILFKIIGTSDESSLIVYLLAPILTIVICLIMAQKTKHFFPNFYKLLTGNRG